MFVNLFLQSGGDQSSLVHLGSDEIGSAAYDPVTPLPELPTSAMHGDDDDDSSVSTVPNSHGGGGGPVTQLHIGEVIDQSQEEEEDSVMHTMQDHVKQERHGE